MTKAFLIDIKRCIGCRACQVACKRWNSLPGAQTSLSPSWTNSPTTTAYTWTRVRFVELDGGDGDFKWRFIKEQCMHCFRPRMCFSMLRRCAPQNRGRDRRL
ncbi:MAG: 4Fe-4S dicluster domain-containing protein [Candidatus Caldarchaeum sp.]